MARMGRFHPHFYNILYLPFGEFTQQTVINLLNEIQGIVFVIEMQCVCCQIVCGSKYSIDEM
jgi:hypothetical protein